MTNLISRYLVRPVSSLSAFIVMLLLIPFTIAMMFLLGLASLLVHRRLRGALSATRSQYTQSQNTRTQNMQNQPKERQKGPDGLHIHKSDRQDKPPIEGNYTVIENK